MCVSSMKSRICGKSSKSGFHLKGTTFEDKLPLQPMSKQGQTKQRIESAHDFPPLSQALLRRQNQGQTEEAYRNAPLSQMQLGRQTQGQTEEAYRNAAQQENNFKCSDCPASFKYRNELNNHNLTVHPSDKERNEASFLDAIQKTLDKILPKFVDSAMVTIQNRIQTNPTGSNMQNMRWGLIPANLN